MSPIPLFGVDAFTREPFRGNPAAVCLFDAPTGAAADAAWMQSIAAEMNLSETAFVAARADGDLDLRWFTPTVEVALCGHATLAAAHTLWESGRLAPGAAARFHTASGVLVATLSGDRLVELDFPALPNTAVDPVPGLETALGAPVVATARNAHDLLAEVADAATVRTLAPDLALLAGIDVRAVVVTAASDDPNIDFVSRCFAPRAGIPEDPVTGSAHCALAPYWSGRFGRRVLVGFQASARGGVVECRLEDPDRVVLGGGAVTVWRGELAT